MRNINNITVRGLSSLYTNFELHRKVVWADFVSVLSEGIKYNTMVAQRNFMQSLIKNNWTFDNDTNIFGQSGFQKLGFYYEKHY